MMGTDGIERVKARPHLRQDIHRVIAFQMAEALLAAKTDVADEAACRATLEAAGFGERSIAALMTKARAVANYAGAGDDAPQDVPSALAAFEAAHEAAEDSEDGDLIEAVYPAFEAVMKAKAEGPADVAMKARAILIYRQDVRTWDNDTFCDGDLELIRGLLSEMAELECMQ